MYRKNIKAYTTQNLQSELAVADPYRVIQLLMQGCLERLAQARGAIERRDFEGKSQSISKTLAIKIHWTCRMARYPRICSRFMTI